MNQQDVCEHLWRWEGSKRQRAWRCAYCQHWRFTDPPVQSVSNEAFNAWLESPFTKALKQAHKVQIEKLENTLGEAIWQYGEWRRKAEALENKEPPM